MPMLIPCPGCQRHVRVGDSACPFCGASVRSDAGAARRVARPNAGLKRAALFALSATVAASACGGESEDSGKSPAAASQATDTATGTMPTPTPTDDGSEQPSEEGDSPSDTATTGTLPGILPGEPNPAQPTPTDPGDDLDDPPVVEPEPSMDPAPTMKPDPTPPKPTGPSSPPTAVALYGAVPAPIEDPPVAEADAGTGEFDPEGNGGAPDIDEPEAAGGADGSGGRNDPPQVQPLYGAVPAPQE